MNEIRNSEDSDPNTIAVSENILKLLESDIDEDKCLGITLFLSKCESVAALTDDEIKRLYYKLRPLLIHDCFGKEEIAEYNIYIGNVRQMFNERKLSLRNA